MKRLTRAPNLALATLWADLLTNAGVEATVQRMYASSIAEELPPDQALPEVWISDDAELERARGLLDALRHPAHRHWARPACRERRRSLRPVLELRRRPCRPARRTPE